jgi:hypothetical protein
VSRISEKWIRRGELEFPVYPLPGLFRNQRVTNGPLDEGESSDFRSLSGERSTKIRGASDTLLDTVQKGHEVGTNSSGKARFTGLPDRTKQGLFFRASEGGRQGSAFVDPVKTCKAELTIALEKKTQ